MVANNKYTYEYVKEYVENNNCFLLSPLYINSNEKLEIVFECGHYGKMSFCCFKRGQRCPMPICSLNKFKESVENKTREKILNEALKNEIEVISFENNHASWDGKMTYKCKKGHVVTQGIREFMRNSYCKECSIIALSENQKGEKGNNWQSGKTKLSRHIKSIIVEWKKESMKNCNYKCVLTGRRFDDIHHLYPLNKIIDEALENLDLIKQEYVGQYSQKEIDLISNEVVRLHTIYPLGVCLTKEVHWLFHKTYGNKNTSPEDFYKFSKEYLAGEFTIN